MPVDPQGGPGQPDLPHQAPGAASQGLLAVPVTPPPEMRKANPALSWRPQPRAKFLLTLRDTFQRGRPDVVPFSGVYDFPGASGPGDARE